MERREVIGGVGALTVAAVLLASLTEGWIPVAEVQSAAAYALVFGITGFLVWGFRHRIERFATGVTPSTSKPQAQPGLLRLRQAPPHFWERVTESIVAGVIAVLSAQFILFKFLSLLPSAAPVTIYIIPYVVLSVGLFLIALPLIGVARFLSGRGPEKFAAARPVISGIVVSDEPARKREVERFIYCKKCGRDYPDTRPMKDIVESLTSPLETWEGRKVMCPMCDVPAKLVTRFKET